ncbi:MAG: right-handed parallel beta-helix repeat-containing protein [Barnesiella sp.]|nr:right-handed parallel beta-helix repeat-containing protein [Barnesiella sp.]
MRKGIFAGLMIASTCASMSAAVATYNVPAIEGDATQVLKQVIDMAQANPGGAVINLAHGAVYNISRTSATPLLRYVSNTTSVDENFDHGMKYIALYFKDAENITLNGNGATFITHGELTTFALEQCDGVTLKNFTLDAADPSVPEFTVTESDDRRIRVKVTAPSRYEIDPDSTFYWVGEGWRFTDGLAQVYFPDKKITWRYDNPIRRGTKAVEVAPGVVDLYYQSGHPFRTGEIYQMRHTIRNQVCGFINESRDVTLEGLNLQFIGNFGIVSQNSADITIDNCRMAPDPASGRTCAGFADFLQFSGCRGHIEVDNCYFSGAHDDAINVHGTHMRIVGQPDDRSLRLRYMHNQSWGFNSFEKGDSVEIVNVHSLLGEFAGKVTESRQLDDYEWVITLDRPVATLDLEDGRAVENISATPSLRVADNYFTLVPTRGILVTTRRPVEIVNNLFDRIPMPAIHISDDARGWYESGPVRDVTIKGNRFVECGSPVVCVNPETDRYEGPVHTGIRIIDNEFVMNGGEAIGARGVADVTVSGNTITGNHEPQPVRVELDR